MSLKSKGESRKRIKALIGELSKDMRYEKSLGVSKNILSFLNEYLPKKLPSYSSEGIIGGFAPMHDEVDWLQGSEYLVNRLAFPGTCENGNMIFFQSRPQDLVESTVFGVTIKSPPVDAKEVTPVLLLIPGLGFGRSGERLGRGKGFYDKYLENFNGLKIGICTSEQILEGIPTEAHDIAMDGLITETEILLFDS